MNIACWNVRGLNKPLRQREVVCFLRSNNVALVGLLETRVKQNKAGNARKLFGPTWQFVNNYSSAINGRIWVGWDASRVSFQPLSDTDQVLHGYFTDHADSFHVFVSFIYGANDGDGRVALGQKMRRIAGFITEAWLVLGDFINVLRSADCIDGNLVIDTECLNFREIFVKVHCFGIVL